MVALRGLEKDAAKWLWEKVSPYMVTQRTGQTVMFAYISQRNIQQMLNATTIALVVVSIVLIYALRSPRLGAASLVPAIIGFGGWGATGGQGRSCDLGRGSDDHWPRDVKGVTALT